MSRFCAGRKHGGATPCSSPEHGGGEAKTTDYHGNNEFSVLMNNKNVDQIVKCNNYYCHLQSCRICCKKILYNALGEYYRWMVGTLG